MNETISQEKENTLPEGVELFNPALHEHEAEKLDFSGSGDWGVEYCTQEGCGLEEAAEWYYEQPGLESKGDAIRWATFLRENPDKYKPAYLVCFNSSRIDIQKDEILPFARSNPSMVLRISNPTTAAAIFAEMGEPDQPLMESIHTHFINVRKAQAQ